MSNFSFYHTIKISCCYRSVFCYTVQLFCVVRNWDVIGDIRNNSVGLDSWIDLFLFLLRLFTGLDLYIALFELLSDCFLVWFAQRDEIFDITAISMNVALWTKFTIPYIAFVAFSIRLLLHYLVKIEFIIILECISINKVSWMVFYYLVVLVVIHFGTNFGAIKMNT